MISFSSSAKDRARKEKIYIRSKNCHCYRLQLMKLASAYYLQRFGVIALTVTVHCSKPAIRNLINVLCEEKGHRNYVLCVHKYVISPEGRYPRCNYHHHHLHHLQPQIHWTCSDMAPQHAHRSVHGSPSLLHWQRFVAHWVLQPHRTSSIIA